MRTTTEAMTPTEATVQAGAEAARESSAVDFSVDSPVESAEAAMLAGLPRRPRLLPGLPVLRRTAGETQVGVDPRYAVVISDAPDELTMLLPRVDGRDTLEDLLARAGPANQVALVQALTGLAEFGLIEDAAPPGRSPSDAVGGTRRRCPADRHADAAASRRSRHRFGCFGGRVFRRRQRPQGGGLSRVQASRTGGGHGHRGAVGVGVAAPTPRRSSHRPPQVTVI